MSIEERVSGVSLWGITGYPPEEKVLTINPEGRYNERLSKYKLCDI